MLCLETLRPPVSVPEVKPPVQAIKRYDMTDNQAWQSWAERWIQSYGAAQIAKQCEKEIKALVPDDASAAHGHGIIVTHNRAGSMSLREAT